MIYVDILMAYDLESSSTSGPLGFAPVPRRRGTAAGAVLRRRAAGRRPGLPRRTAARAVVDVRGVGRLHAVRHARLGPVRGERRAGVRLPGAGAVGGGRAAGVADGVPAG